MPLTNTSYESNVDYGDFYIYLQYVLHLVFSIITEVAQNK